MGSQKIIDIAISWAPMILLIIVWVIFMRRMQAKGSPQQRLIDLYSEQIAQTKIMNTILERIAVTLEKDRDGHPQRSTMS